MDRTGLLAAISQALLLVVAAAALCIWLQAPYVVAAFLILSIMAVGHLVHVGDTRPGGPLNEEGSVGIWHRSITYLVLKAVAAAALLGAMSRYPELNDYSW